MPVETLETAPQDVRDRVMHDLIALVLRELFDWRLMQTDPNFANYRWQPETGQLVLLDFGATRPVPPRPAKAIAACSTAALAGDRDAVREAAIAAGFLGEAAVLQHRALVDRMIDVILVELAKPGPFDFGDRAFVGVLREQGTEIARDRDTWHLPADRHAVRPAQDQRHRAARRAPEGAGRRPRVDPAFLWRSNALGRHRSSRIRSG